MLRHLHFFLVYGGNAIASSFLFTFYYLLAAHQRGTIMLVPPWLESLLSTPFFSICPSHRDSARNERNMYCLDCVAAAAGFCFYCRSARHKDHPVIEIRRSSYHDVVRMGEVDELMDISGVQTYVINSARVVFLNERPQPKGPAGDGASHL